MGRRRRKGRKPPRSHPAALASAAPIAPPAGAAGGKPAPVFYSPRQKEKLEDRLHKITHSVCLVAFIIGEMQRLRWEPAIDHLKRRLARAGIWPPKMEPGHHGQRECACRGCRLIRLWPPHSVPRGLSFECWLERNAPDPDVLVEPGLAEERARLAGDAPGVVKDMRAILKSRARRREGRAA